MYLYILYVKIHIFLNSEIVVIESNICILSIIDTI